MTKSTNGKGHQNYRVAEISDKASQFSTFFFNKNILCLLEYNCFKKSQFGMIIIPIISQLFTVALLIALHFLISLQYSWHACQTHLPPANTHMLNDKSHCHRSSMTIPKFPWLQYTLQSLHRCKLGTQSGMTFA